MPRIMFLGRSHYPGGFRRIYAPGDRVWQRQGETVTLLMSRYRSPAGRLITIDFMLAPMRGEDDVIIGLIASAVDITERQRLTEERFQAFLDVSPDALILIDAEGKIGSVSVEAERLFGYSREEFIGQRVEWLMTERDRAAHTEHRRSYFANPRRRLMGSDFEVYGLTRNGREIPLEVGLSPMAMPHGLMTLAAVRDITQRKQAEQALRSAKEEAVSANALKSRFIAAASHDLRQPLQTMALLGGVLAKTVRDEASRKAVEATAAKPAEAMGEQSNKQPAADLERGSTVVGMEPDITNEGASRSDRTILNRPYVSQFAYAVMETASRNCARSTSIGPSHWRRSSSPRAVELGNPSVQTRSNNTEIRWHGF